MSDCIERARRLLNNDMAWDDDAIADVLTGLVAEVELLMDWKRDAMRVLNGWDRVWEALGKPGPLGAMKSANALAAVQRLTRLGNELADAVPVRAPMVASQPYRNGYQDCIERMRAAVEAWEGR